MKSSYSLSAFSALGSDFGESVAGKRREEQQDAPPRSKADRQLRQEGSGFMRKILDLISLAILAALFLTVGLALYGAARLPARIPTHFDAAGNANGWGSPLALLFLPFIALGVYLLLTVAARFSALFNYPGWIKITDENRPRLEALTVDLLAWMKAEMVCLFAAITWIWLHAIRRPEKGFSPLWTLTVAGAILVTIACYIRAMVRAAR